MVLSPAKSLDFTAAPEGAPLTTPVLLDDIGTLARVAKRLSAADLKRLMSISDSLANLNRERFQAFDAACEDGLQAAFAFNGDVYAGLRARNLDHASLLWAQDHVRILSGLYGVLRPLDAMQPYRLEMGVRLKTPRGSNLYEFWGDRIARTLAADLAGHAEPVLVNLASNEYFQAVDRSALNVPVLSIRFLEERDGAAKVISFFAKKARGLMARFAIENRIDRIEGLKDFTVEGYGFRPDLSGDGEWTFSRVQAAAAA